MHLPLVGAKILFRIVVVGATAAGMAVCVEMVGAADKKLKTPGSLPHSAADDVLGEGDAETVEARLNILKLMDLRQNIVNL